MKKALAYIGCVSFTWCGAYAALIANVSDDHPYDQGGLSLIAVILFCAALLCAGYGNSITWKGKKKEK